MRRLIAKISLLLPIAALGLAAFAAPAMASGAVPLANNGQEICAYYVNSLGINVPESPCMDAYNNGGALVKSYGPGNTYEDFQLVSIGNGNYQIQYIPNGTCVGDNGNNPSDAKAADNLRCPSIGNAGWGTIYHYVNPCQGGGGNLYNTHWAGYLDGGVANGTQWYLNNQGSQKCLFPFGS